MEQPGFPTPISTSPETKEINVFDEYSPRPNYVLENLNDLDVITQANYEKVNVGNKNVFVRNDVLADIKERSKNFRPTKDPSVVHRVLRPVFRKSYESKDRKDLEEVVAILIMRKQEEDQKRIEVVKFIESFPLDIQQKLKTGVFMIDSEGRYYSSVAEGEKSFSKADVEKDFESKKAGDWKRGLLEALKAGSPYVKSFLPSTISGVVDSFRAELKDGTVTAVVAGNNFSTFGNNNLSCRIEFEESGSIKEVTKSFEAF